MDANRCAMEWRTESGSQPPPGTAKGTETAEETTGAEGGRGCGTREGGMEAAGEVLGPPRGFEREGFQGVKGDRRAGRPIERENSREEKEGEEAKRTGSDEDDIRIILEILGGMRWERSCGRERTLPCECDANIRETDGWRTVDLPMDTTHVARRHHETKDERCVWKSKKERSQPNKQGATPFLRAQLGRWEA